MLRVLRGRSSPRRRILRRRRIVARTERRSRSLRPNKNHISAMRRGSSVAKRLYAYVQLSARNASADKGLRPTGQSLALNSPTSQIV